MGETRTIIVRVIRAVAREIFAIEIVLHLVQHLQPAGARRRFHDRVRPNDSTCSATAQSSAAVRYRRRCF